MNNKWDNRFLDFAHFVSHWSKDPSTKVGAVIVNNLNRVIGVGYNGFPRGVDDLEQRYNDRPLKHLFTVHAELNAILNANSKVEGGTLYVWPTFYKRLPPVCHECAKAIIQAGIIRVVGAASGVRDDDPQWKESYFASATLLREARVEVSHVG